MENTKSGVLKVAGRLGGQKDQCCRCLCIEWCWHPEWPIPATQENVQGQPGLPTRSSQANIEAMLRRTIALAAGLTSSRATPVLRAYQQYIVASDPAPVA